MKNFLLTFIAFVALFVLILSGCAPTPDPTPTPTPTPTGTVQPDLNIVRDGPDRILASGDPVRFNRGITFQGSAPSSSLIRVYRDGTQIDQFDATPAGAFTWWWSTGATEGTFVFEFTATQAPLGESLRTSFTVVVDGTPPFLESLEAKADPVGSPPPQVTVFFNEPIEVGDMAFFTLPASWVVNTVIGISVFNTTEVELGADQRSVILTGDWQTDFLVAGNSIQVIFIYDPAMGVTDRAGNEIVPPIFVTGTVMN